MKIGMLCIDKNGKLLQQFTFAGGEVVGVCEFGGCVFVVRVSGEVRLNSACTAEL